MFRYLPEQASSSAADIDWLHNLITDLSVFFTVAIVGAMLYFAVRYRKRNGVDHETPQIRGSHFFEVVWTVVPTIICIFIGYYGVKFFLEAKRIPANALTVYATGRQWKWDFKYESGKKTTGDLVVPVNKPVKVVITSTDVLHNFAIPAMRVKSDAVKGQYTYVAFTPIKTGEYHIFCDQYCGKAHYAMLGTVRVVAEDEYSRWVNDLGEKEMNPIEKGKLIYTQKGCNACHSLNGTRVVGPTWLKLYGSARKFADGTTTTADENYIRESVLKPNAKIVEGYPANIMPAFEGQLSESDIIGIIAYIKSLDGSEPAAPASEAVAVVAKDLSKLKPEERGKLIYEEGKGAGPACKSCHSLDGSKIVGPSWKGLYGRQAKWTDGQSYTATDDYIKESIYVPNAHIVEGYAPGMIPYQGILNDDDVKDLIAFIKTVK